MTSKGTYEMTQPGFPAASGYNGQPQTSPSCCSGKTCLIVMGSIFCFLVVAGAVVGGVCGSGLCSPKLTSAYITGTVTGYNASLIGGAIVTAQDGSTTTTDSNGHFAIWSPVNRTSLQTSVTVTYPGLTPNVGTVVIIDQKQESYNIYIDLLPFTASIDFYGDVGINGYSLELINGTASLTIKPENSYGNGLYTLNITVVPPESGPGLLRPSAITANGGNALQSAAMIYMIITNSSGVVDILSQSPSRPTTTSPPPRIRRI